MIYTRLRTLFLTIVVPSVFLYGVVVGRYEAFPFAYLQDAYAAATGRHAPAVRWATDPLYHHRVSLFDSVRPSADVVMVGDSITQLAEWRDLFPNVLIANRGISGDTTAGLLRRHAAITALRPKTVAVMAGVNDFTILDATPDDVFERYKELVATFSASGARVIVQSTLLTSSDFKPSVNDRIMKLNTALSAYCLDGHCTFLDVNRVLAPAGFLSASYSRDGVHLNGDAIQEWARLLEPHILHVSTVEAR